MSVLVVGANGYIGFAVAQAFRQNGYKVFGLVRQPQQTKKLISNEIIPILGDATKPETYEHVLKTGVTVVVDASFDPSGRPGNSAVLEVAKKHSSPHGKVVYIYTSGILVHGDNPHVVSEETPLKHGPALQARAKFELEAINSKEVHGIVIRPGFVYGIAGGNPGGNTGKHVFTLTDGKIVISGKRDKRWSWVHIHDLARAYVLAVENFPSASGQIFNVADINPPTIEQFRKKTAELAGHKDAEVVVVPVAENDFFGHLIDQTTIVSYRKAQNLLGWTPKHLNVLDDLEEVYAAYKEEASTSH